MRDFFFNRQRLLVASEIILHERISLALILEIWELQNRVVLLISHSFVARVTDYKKKSVITLEKRINLPVYMYVYIYIYICIYITCQTL